MHYRLLTAFQGTFLGQKYVHRNQGIGNFIASHLYEDLLALNRSSSLAARVNAGIDVVNTPNRVIGRTGRRGDGTFGALVPGEQSHPETGFVIQRGPIAILEIGTEVKILAKAMIKQIDRVMNDLIGQARTFREQTPDAITVAIVGINHSATYTSYEGSRAYDADVPPEREAPKVIERMLQRVPNSYDELLILRFRATNVEPFPFEWVNEAEVRKLYSASLLRISSLFDARFGTARPAM